MLPATCQCIRLEFNKDTQTFVGSRLSPSRPLTNAMMMHVTTTTQPNDQYTMQLGKHSFYWGRVAFRRGQRLDDEEHVFLRVVMER